MCDATTCIGCSRKAEIREKKKEEMRKLIMHMDDDMQHHDFLKVKMNILTLIDEIE